MEDLIIKYIKDNVSGLKYKGDTVDLKNVYPSILEDAMGSFDGPYSLNGYDCDYWSSVGDYEISGCMRFGVATVELVKGKVEPVSQEENSKSEKIPVYRTVEIEDLSEEEYRMLNTYYFTFGNGQKNGGMYQPIMAKDMSTAYEKMLEMYGTAWSSHYNQEQWDDVWKDWGVLYEGKELKKIAVLNM